MMRLPQNPFQATVRVVGALLLMSLAACMTMSAPENPEPTVPQAPPLAYKFAFEPVKQANATPVGIGLGRIEADTGSSCQAPDVNEVLAVFTQSLQSAFQATLLAKGYTLSGPFSSREQMTYGEKEKAMLLLVPHLTVRCTCPEVSASSVWEGRSGTVRRGYNSKGDEITARGKATLIKNEGTVRVEFSLDLALLEPLTGEKLWLKTVKADPSLESFSHYTRRVVYEAWEGSIGDLVVGTGRTFQVGDPEVTELSHADTRPNASASALERLFASSMTEFSRYFDPREISEVVKDAERVRKLKRY